MAATHRHRWPTALAILHCHRVNLLIYIGMEVSHPSCAAFLSDLLYNSRENSSKSKAVISWEQPRKCRMHFSFPLLKTPLLPKNFIAGCENDLRRGDLARPSSIVAEIERNLHPEAPAWESRYCDVADNAANEYSCRSMGKSSPPSVSTGGNQGLAIGKQRECPTA